ncbi:hypothetical protein CDAR_7721 [Caerostris darwini]|uniref:Uncharacterized protein n=1 Tax=Caerostris darwini TaxID=1538125 RepID=A0AAV4R8B3_9ARAC|nr:hypothetical protein CDAR_7721 [Caerostris darwini]
METVMFLCEGRKQKPPQHCNLIINGPVDSDRDLVRVANTPLFQTILSADDIHLKGRGRLMATWLRHVFTYRHLFRANVCGLSSPKKKKEEENDLSLKPL